MLTPEIPAAALRSLPVIVNAGSGAGHSHEAVGELERAFREAGVGAQVIAARGEEIRAAAVRAMGARPTVLVAGGGDGTISAVADVVRGTGTALGILPMGTLNHFAKDLRIPLDIPGALRTIAAGRCIAVDVAEVNGTCFINNSSLGIYPDIVRERARQQRRLGRSKWSAMLRATLAVLGRSPLLDLRLRLHDGEKARETRCHAPFLFIGNNRYFSEGFSIGTRERLDAGSLSVYTTKRCGGAGLVLLALRALFGGLSQADDFSTEDVIGLRVESRKARLSVATDGEVRIMDTPLEYRIVPGALRVVVP